jgi:membrane protein required for beta-lactamase induction
MRVSMGWTRREDYWASRRQAGLAGFGVVLGWPVAMLLVLLVLLVGC